MNLLEILKKIFSCTMPQAASEGDMDLYLPLIKLMIPLLQTMQK